MFFRRFGTRISSGNILAFQRRTLREIATKRAGLSLGRIWKFNDETSEAIAELRKGLALSADNYFTVQIRRGDKKSEADTFALHEYIRLAKRFNAMRERTTCLVMTDDYSVITELRTAYPEYQFVSLCPKSDRGHEQAAFNSLSPGLRRQRTLALLAELSMATEGSFFVGTFSSNIGRFVALLRGLETTYSVDGPFTMLRYKNFQL